MTDFAPGMLAAARRRAAELGITNADFRELDGERMALESECVDGVVCRWGYMLMSDPAAAFRETARVMRPAGRLAFSVFGAADRNPWASLVGRILVEEKHIPAPISGSPGIFALSDPERIHALLAGAGFAAPGLGSHLAHPARPGPQAQAKVRTRLGELAEPFRAGDGYAFPALCLNVATRKPA